MGLNPNKPTAPINLNKVTTPLADAKGPSSNAPKTTHTYHAPAKQAPAEAPKQAEAPVADQQAQDAKATDAKELAQKAMTKDGGGNKAATVAAKTASQVPKQNKTALTPGNNQAPTVQVAKNGQTQNARAATTTAPTPQSQSTEQISQQSGQVLVADNNQVNQQLQAQDGKQLKKKPPMPFDAALSTMTPTELKGFMAGMGMLGLAEDTYQLNMTRAGQHVGGLLQQGSDEIKLADMMDKSIKKAFEEMGITKASATQAVEQANLSESHNEGIVKFTGDMYASVHGFIYDDLVSEGKIPSAGDDSLNLDSSMLT